jgi:hypothetical protein
MKGRVQVILLPLAMMAFPFAPGTEWRKIYQQSYTS